jgi:ADP-heptose:LPS heptosyltransferase
VFDSLRRYIGLQVTRFHFRKSADPVISFAAALTEAKRVLLVMPMGETRMIPTHTVVDLVKKKFDERNITVLARDHAVETMRLLPRGQFIHILKEEISPLFIPRKQLINRIKERSYDVAIDLSLDLVLPSAYIVRESEARVRIGFSRQYADIFYNFQIHSNPDLDPKLIYNRLAECLAMF